MPIIASSDSISRHPARPPDLTRSPALLIPNALASARRPAPHRWSRRLVRRKPPQPPLIEPDMRFSLIRLSDGVHVVALVGAG
jgi:hypothetical protein